MILLKKGRFTILQKTIIGFSIVAIVVLSFFIYESFKVIDTNKIKIVDVDYNPILNLKEERDLNIVVHIRNDGKTEVTVNHISVYRDWLEDVYIGLEPYISSQEVSLTLSPGETKSVLVVTENIEDIGNFTTHFGVGLSFSEGGFGYYGGKGLHNLPLKIIS